MATRNKLWPEMCRNTPVWLQIEQVGIALAGEIKIAAFLDPDCISRHGYARGKQYSPNPPRPALLRNTQTHVPQRR